MKTYWYVLDVNPTPWQIGPVGAIRSNDGKRYKGYVGKNQELDNYKKAVADLLREQNPVKLSGEVEITFYFWRQQVQYATDKRAKGAGNQAADGTNLMKASEDACQGILFDNDRSNVSGHWHIIEQGVAATSKVIIRVREISATHRDDVLQEIPDAVYEVAFPSGQLLLAAVEGSTEKIAGDGSEYDNAEPIF